MGWGRRSKVGVVFFQRMQFRTLARKFAALPDEVKTSNEGQTDLFSSIDVQPGQPPGYIR